MDYKGEIIMNIPFTVEELKRFAENGTLDGHLQSHGILPLQALIFVLSSPTLEEYIEELEDIIEKQEYRLSECSCE